MTLIKRVACGITLAVLLLAGAPAMAESPSDTVLVEAESFTNPGGWVLDTQFIEIMGSPYLMAHGLGVPVADATTTVKLPGPGTYKVFVRTKDWVAHWKAPGAPGKFQLLINGKPMSTTFGTVGEDWFWHDGGTVEISNPNITLALHDLTGFNGRADAIIFTKDLSFVPSNDSKILPGWRRQLLGLTDKPENPGKFDLVVIGGGYGGTATAISAARMGLKVALVQNRPVLGGNGSSEVRVWAKGGTRRGDYPTLGEIVAEFEDHATSSPGHAEEFGDDKKEAIVKAEPNISLFLNHHAYRVEMAGKDRIAAVIAIDTRTSREKRFEAPLFADCTGHAYIGAKAGADHTTQLKQHLGMSNMWRWEETPAAQTFPGTPWALDLTMDDFPYPRRFHGEWFWESGFDKHPLDDLEYIRDWNLRAVFGAFNAMKNKDGADEHKNARLVWVAYIGGTRESRQLLGDVILNRDDIVNKRKFPDGLVPTTWDIDLHYPKEQYAKKFPDNPFISKAVFDKAVDRKHGYPVPYRCFYSRNIRNLFMAGRNVSVDQQALGTVRVMKTGGMMGEVVGKAASICIQKDCLPRDVYSSYLDELLALCKLPGAARRADVNSPIQIPAKLPDLKPENDLGLEPASLGGIVVDDNQARLSGQWNTGEGLRPFVADHYRYASPNSGAEARFEIKVPAGGKYDVRLFQQPHENRSSQTLVTVITATGQHEVRVNQKAPSPIKPGLVSIGTYQFTPDKPAVVTITTAGANGNVHIDAVQLVPAK